VLTPARLHETYGVRAWFGSIEGVPVVVPLTRDSAQGD
jgi:iron complex transport system ATP-binding protein